MNLTRVTPPSNRRIALAASIALALLLPSAAHAGWSTTGIPLVSQYADRVFPEAAPDGAGGAYTVWQEEAVVRLQRLTSEGAPAPGWSGSTGLVVCDEPAGGGFMQTSPRVVPDGLGGVFVIWHDERNSGCTHSCIGETKQIFAQRIGSNGTIVNGWPALGVDVGAAPGWMTPTAAGERGGPLDLNTVVVADGKGGLLVAWIEAAGPPPSTAIPGLHVQRVSPAGQMMWSATGRLVCDGSANPRFPAIAPDGAGGVYLVWQDLRDAPDGSRIFGQHLSAAGLPLMSPNGERVSHRLLPDERYPQVVALDRGMLVTWEAGTASSPRALLARRIGPTRRGVPEVELLLSSALDPGSSVSLLPQPGSGAWVGWIDLRHAGSEDVYLQRIDSWGRRAPGWASSGNPVCVTPSASRAHPILNPDGAGGVFVAWRDVAEPRAARVLSDGGLAPGWPAEGLVLTSEPGVDRGLDLVFDGLGGGFVVWDQWFSMMGMDDVRAQRVDRDGLAALAGPSAPSDPLAVGAPASTRLELLGLLPNPAEYPRAIGFSLPTAEPALLELFDVTGRRIASWEVGSLGAGRHFVPLEAGHRLAPGVYLVRLEQSNQSLTRRGVVIH